MVLPVQKVTLRLLSVLPLWVVLHALEYGERTARGIDGGRSGEYTRVFKLPSISISLKKATVERT